MRSSCGARESFDDSLERLGHQKNPGKRIATGLNEKMIRHLDTIVQELKAKNLDKFR